MAALGSIPRVHITSREFYCVPGAATIYLMTKPSPHFYFCFSCISDDVDLLKGATGGPSNDCSFPQRGCDAEGVFPCCCADAHEWELLGPLVTVQLNPLKDVGTYRELTNAAK